MVKTGKTSDVVKVYDPIQKFNVSYYLDPKLKENFDEKLIPSLQTKDKDAVIVVDGQEGCLAGDTLIQCSRGKVSRKYTIKRLYNHYNNNPDSIIQKGKLFDLSIPTYIRAFNGNEIRLHKIKNVMYSGRKLTYVLKLKNGNEIKATASHKFLTRNGWKALKDIKIGEELMCDTLHSSKNKRKRIKLYDIRLKVDYHPYSINGRVEVHRLIYESYLNKLHFLEFLDILLNDKEKSSKLKYINPSQYHIHHKDGCHYNNSIENLELIKKENHLKYHGKSNYTNFSQGIPFFSQVVTIKEHKAEDVYDIECEDPYHNFVANGIVVHNSGKSTLALQLGKYVDPTLNLDRVVFTAEEFRNAIYKAKKGQCVIYDEAFTGFSSRSSLSAINRALVGLMMQMRQKNLFVIVVLPTFFLLDKYVALFRTKALIHVYENKGIRGYFRVYNRKKKKYLYLAGKQTYSYGSKKAGQFVYTKFKGRFHGTFALGDEKVDAEYRKRKEKALKETEKNPMTAGQVKYREQRDIIMYLFRKITKMKYREMSNLFGDYDLEMSDVQISRICAKFGEKSYDEAMKSQNNNKFAPKSDEKP